MFWHVERGQVKDRIGQHGSNANMVPVHGDKGEMLQSRHELLKQAEEKRKVAMIQQEGLVKSKHVKCMSIGSCHDMSFVGSFGWADRAAESFDC